MVNVKFWCQTFTVKEQVIVSRQQSAGESAEMSVSPLTAASLEGAGNSATRVV